MLEALLGGSRRSPVGIRQKKRPSTSRRAGSFALANLLFAALLAIATIAIYIPVIGHSFLVLDDQEYVTANSHIHQGLTWNTIKWAFTATVAANWHPLTWLSHALDYQIFGLNPAGHHLDSVLLHALNAVLLFLLLAWSTKRPGPSLLVAALFALHPINVESVAWIAERKNVLSTLFFILAIGAYVWYARKPEWRRYLLLAALFAAGLMAKPMVVTLPFVLLLLDYWPLERVSLDRTPSHSASTPPVSPAKLLLEKIPLLFLSAASAWITLKAQRSAVRTFEDLPLTLRIENAATSYALYLWKMVWPVRLAFYPHAATLPAWQWILSSLVLVATTITAFAAAFRGKRYLLFGWLWFLGTLVPVIGLVQVGEYAMADRYAYVPLIGIFIMIAWSLDDLAESKRIRIVWRVIPALCVMAALSVVTFRQLNLWESDYDLWSHTLEVGESPLAHNALGMALMHPESELTPKDLEAVGTQQNRMDEARQHFERALELPPPPTPHASGASLADRARTLNNLGNLDRLQNRIDEARQHGEQALEIYRHLAQQSPDVYVPYLAATLNNLGAIDRLQNRMEEARQLDEEAVAIQRQLAQQDPAKYLPNLAMTLNEFGLLDGIQDHEEQARQHYEEALKIDRQLAEQSPSTYLHDLAMTLTNFGRLEAMHNRMEDAHQLYQEAAMLDRQLAQQNPGVYLPDLAMTLNNLGRVDQLQNRIEESRDNYREALSIFRTLLQADSRYAGQVTGVEASLEELDRNVTSRKTMPSRLSPR